MDAVVMKLMDDDVKVECQYLWSFSKVKMKKEPYHHKQLQQLASIS